MRPLKTYKNLIVLLFLIAGMMIISLPVYGDKAINEELKQIASKETDEQVEPEEEMEIRGFDGYSQRFNAEAEEGFDCDSLCVGISLHNERRYETNLDCVDTCRNAVDTIHEHRQLPQCEAPEDMVLIPSGTYLKYPPSDSFLPFVPAVVVLTNDFYIDKYEVTQREFENVMGFNPAYYQGKKCGKNCPVESITWDEADEYCRGLGKRIPTASEWEYAAKAGTSTLHYWGEELNLDYLWYKNNSGGRPKPVGMKLPNNYGLYDMEGNVFEYVQDCELYTMYTDGLFIDDAPKITIFVDPIRVDNNCHTKIIKGSSFAYEGKQAAPHFSYFQDVNERRGDRGFRCVMDAYSQQCEQITD